MLGGILERVRRVFPMLRPGSFGGDAFESLIGGVASRLVTLAAMPFVTQLYGASDYGVWVIVLTMSGFFVPIATLRYDLAMVLCPTKRMAAALAIAIGGFTLVVAIVAGIGLALAPQDVISAISGIDIEHRRLFTVAPLLLILLVAQVVMQAWATRERRFRILNIAQLAQAVTTAGATLTLPMFVGASAATATVGGILGLAIGALVLTLAFGNSMIAAISHRSTLANVRHGVMRYKVYAIYVVPYSLSAGVMERVVQLLLASAYSPAMVGEFFVARQLMLAPATFIGTALRQTLFAYGAQQDSRETLKRRVAALLSMLAAVIVPTVCFGAFWLKYAIKMCFGASWTYLPEFVSWNLAVGGASLLVVWLDRVFDVLSLQGLSTNLKIASDVLVITALILCVSFRLDPVTTVAIWSGLMTVVSLIQMPIVLGLLGYEKDFVISSFARLCGSAVGWIVVFYLVFAFDSGLIGFGISAALLAAAIGHRMSTFARQYCTSAPIHSDPLQRINS